MGDNLNVKPNSYVLFQLCCLQWLGLWPIDTTNSCKLFCYYLYKMLVIIIIVVVSISQILQIGFVSTIEEMSSTVDTATLNISGLYKILYYIIYHEHFKSLVHRFNSNFVEHSIWDRKFKMSDFLRNTKFYTLFYIVSTWIGVIFWTVVPLINKNVFPTRYITNTTTENELYLNGTKNLSNKSIYNNISEIIEDFNYTNIITINKYVCNTLYGNQTQTNVTDCITITETFISETDLDSSLELIEGNRKFPLNCWFPFDTQSSPMYETIFIIEISDLAFTSFSYILTDSFFFLMIYLVCGQLEIIKISLQSLRRLEEEFIKDVITFEVNTNNQGRKYKLSYESLAQQTLVLKGPSVYRDLEKNMCSVLTFCIQHHKMLLEFLQDLEVLYRPLILIDVLHAIISLSFAIFRTSISVNIFDYAKFILFVAVCILHQFLNNYFSEILIYQQTSICETVYDTPWEDHSKAFKHTVLLMMIRARNPVQLNGWKMYFLCLNTFKEFMSTLISYIMVLRQLQSDNRK